MLKNRGMTLTEILIVLIILGIIAAFGIPAFTNIMESSRMNEARINLGIIHMGQRAYRSNNNNLYWNPGGNTTITAINTALSTDIFDPPRYYNNNVSVTANAGNTFTATLGRNGGAPVDWRFTINETGAISCAGTGCPCTVTAQTPLGCA